MTFSPDDDLDPEQWDLIHDYVFEEDDDELDEG